MFIVNAPMMFTGIWAIIKMWLDEKTKNKITILGSSYKEELLKFVPQLFEAIGWPRKPARLSGRQVGVREHWRPFPKHRALEPRRQAASVPSGGKLRVRVGIKGRSSE